MMMIRNIALCLQNNRLICYWLHSGSKLLWQVGSWSIKLGVYLGV